MTERNGFWRVVWGLLDRWTSIVDDVINTRALLALIAFLGFFFIANKVIERLSDPPASELFAVLNLALTPAAAAAGYFFGFKEGQKPGGTP